jgi:LuxR family maltose regulon positive regulatory protein
VDQPGCYRYYPFFRDLLRAQLAYESPELMTDLQRRTGAWFVEHGLLEAGVRHLVRGQLWEEAASVVIDELAVDRLLLSGGRDPLVGLLRHLPARPAGPAHAVVAAALALGNGSVADCERDLEHVSDLADSGAGEDARLRSCRAVVDAVRGRAAGAPDEAVELAARAQEHLEAPGGATPADHPELLAIPRNCLAIGQIRSGRLREAARTLIHSAGAAPQGSALAAEALGFLALVDAMDGRLSRATQNATRSLAIGHGRAVAGFKSSTVAEIALALVALEKYDVDTATQHLASARAAAGPTQDPVVIAFAAIAAAGIDRASGRYGRASITLDVAASNLPGADRWLAGRIRLEAARLHIARGAVQQALDELSTLDGEDRDAMLIAARAHLNRGDDATALRVLSHLHGREAPLQARVTALLLEVAPRARQEAVASVHDPLEQAVRLAAPERLRRPFREAPAEVQQALRRDAELASSSRWLGIGPPPADHVAASERSRRAVTAVAALPAARGHTTPMGRSAGPGTPVVVESLTVKEREVLAHLAEMLSTQEIATAMFVSVNTVRTHVRNILRKLGVTRRNAAVRRGRELGIL